MTADETYRDALRALATEITGCSGDTVCAQLVERLARLLDVEFAFLGRFVGEQLDGVRTLAVWSDGKLIPNIDYRLAGTPCDQVASKDFCLYPENVQLQFPNDPQLGAWGAQGYAAIPLFDASHRPLGILGVVARTRIEDAAKFESLMKLFAARAKAEIERKWVDDAILQSLADLSALIESMDDMIWSVDSRQFRLLTFNSALREYVAGAYRVELHQGMLPEDFLPPEIAALWSDFYRRALLHRSYRISYQLANSAGAVELALNTIAKDGETVGVSVFGKDVTVRKRAEEELKNSRDLLEETVRKRTSELEHNNRRLALEVTERKQAEEATKRYEFIANSITDLIGMVSRDYAYVAVNDAWCVAFQQSRSELIGRTVGSVWGIGLYDQQLKPRLRSCFEGRIESVRLWLTIGIYGRRFCSVAMYPYRNASGDVTHVITLTRDVTVEHEAECALIAARKAAEDASRTKSAFLANMSHEIRTPMNGIIGMTHVLAQSPLTLKQQDHVSKIESSARHLLLIINDILDFSKVEAGKVELEYVDFSPEELLATLVQSVAQQAQQKNLVLTLALPIDTPKSLTGDPLRVTQVLLNLLSNAIKFTPRGEIEVSLAVLARDADSATLRFGVRDTGIGMSEAQIKRLFVPFSQADESTARKYGGTGLGLVISESYIQLMGGDLKVESAPNKGTLFAFDLKFALSKRENSSNASSGKMPAVRRALIVDGCLISRAAMTELLRQLNIDSVVADSGKAAVLEVSRQMESGMPPFDFILVESVQTGMDAIAVAEQISTVCGAKPLPPLILVMTKDDDALIDPAERAGYKAIVTKPIMTSSLRRAIRQAVERMLDVPTPEDEPVVQPLASPNSSRQVKGLHVLLVEDNEINQEIAREILGFAGCHVKAASSGQEALTILFNTEPAAMFDAVLMDLQMPGMDGYKTTRRIRSEARFVKLPIIAMTADAISGVKEKCLEAGMNDYLTKPINVDELYATLGRWVKPKPA